jgi:hypothetical protein
MQTAIYDRISRSLIHLSRGGAISARLDLTELYHEITAYCIAEHVAQKFIWHNKKIGSDSGFLSRYRATILRWPGSPETTLPEPDAKQGYE